MGTQLWGPVLGAERPTPATVRRFRSEAAVKGDFNGAASAGLPLDRGESGGNSAPSPIIPAALLPSFGDWAWPSSGLCLAVGWALLDYN